METSGRNREVVVETFLLIIAVVFDSVQAGRNLTSPNRFSDVKFAKALRGTIKTVQGASGDVVDCVNIYRQPAFDHPLLKDHTIEMKPSFQEEGEGHLHGLPAELEGWGMDCPEGTVPIIRKTSGNGPDVKHYLPPFLIDRKSLDNKSANAVIISPDGHEYAEVVVNNQERAIFYGAQASHNVWNPRIEPGEISVSQIWISKGQDGGDSNTVEAGWMAGYHSSDTRLFTYWTSDGYKFTGCYNLECPGFVQTNKNYAPGFVVPSISKYNGKQFAMDIQIRQDQITGSWWLLLHNTNVGYWPGSIFKGLRDGADGITWGGEIVNRKNFGKHTTAQMGSGHLPREGYYMKSSYIKSLSYIKTNGPMEPVPRGALNTYATNTHCYDVVIGPRAKVLELIFTSEVLDSHRNAHNSF